MCSAPCFTICLTSPERLCFLQGALVKAFAARELGMDADAVERELHKLAALLPDIGAADMH